MIMRYTNLLFTYLLRSVLVRSTVWVSASFQIFALTTGECVRWGIVRAGEVSGGNMSKGKMFGEGKCLILLLVWRLMRAMNAAVA